MKKENVSISEFEIDLQLFSEEDISQADAEAFFEGFDSEDSGTVYETQDDLSVTPTDENNEDSESTPAEESKPVVEAQKIKVKYNHEEREIPIDEATILVQKGLNYDKLQEKLSGLENNPGLAYVQKLASVNNMTVDELVTAWQQAEEQEKINSIADEEQISPELARKLYEADAKSKEAETKLAEIERTKQEEESRIKQYNEFFVEYPEIKPADIPQEVWQYQSQTGRDLIASMQWYENKQMKLELKTLRKTVENVRTNPGVGAVTINEGNKKGSDPFLDAFDSVFDN